jgi:hypothetical protein
MVQEQMGLCAICGHAPIGSFHIDHDHVTGRVRGLLCRNCNLALGLFGDDVPALTRAVTYLVDARKAQESSDFKDKVGPVPGVLT